jgi:hypothetical protein
VHDHAAPVRENGQAEAAPKAKKAPAKKAAKAATAADS